LISISILPSPTGQRDGRRNDIMECDLPLRRIMRVEVVEVDRGSCTLRVLPTCIATVRLEIRLTLCRSLPFRVVGSLETPTTSFVAPSVRANRRHCVSDGSGRGNLSSKTMASANSNSTSNVSGNGISFADVGDLAFSNLSPLSMLSRSKYGMQSVVGICLENISSLPWTVADAIS